MMLVLSIPMPQSDFPRPHDHPPSSNMTSPLMMAPAPVPQQLSAPRSRLQRPKLSINTHQNRTFGKGSSLSLDTLSAVSPTVRNTFSNAYETSRSKANTTPVEEVRPETPTTPEPPESRTPSSGSVSSASTTVELHIIPYKQSHTLHSALANSPIPKSEFRRMSISQNRHRFPPEKRVLFKSPLAEEIKTTKYTWAHSDIESPTSASATGPPPSEPERPAYLIHGSGTSDVSDLSSMSDSTTSSLSRSSSSSPPPLPTSRRTSHRIGRSRIKPRSPRTGDKRDSSSESDSDSCPETPVAGRRKRRKEIEWTWTLGPIAGPARTEESPAPPFGRTPQPIGQAARPLSQQSFSSSTDVSTSTDAVSSDEASLGFSRTGSRRSTESSTTSEESF